MDVLRVVELTAKAARACVCSMRQAFEPALSGAWDGGAGTAERHRKQLVEHEAEQEVWEPGTTSCMHAFDPNCSVCVLRTRSRIDWPNETSAATPPAAVDDPAGGAPASAPLPSAGSPSVPAGVSARTPDIAAPPAGLDPVGTIRTLPNAVAVRIIDGAWSVIWHQWGADTDISEQSWVYRDGSPMAARIAANWPILVRGPAVPLAEACLAVGVSVASEFFPQSRST